MRTIVKHLRGTASEWESNDIIVPDGELAVCRNPDNSLNVKIGDGVNKFSRLHSIATDSKTITSQDNTYEFVAESKTVYHLNDVKSLKIITPDAFCNDYSCMICFDTGNHQAEFTMGNTYFTGDDTQNGSFNPTLNRCYTLFIWYAFSGFQGIVRAIPHL